MEYFIHQTAICIIQHSKPYCCKEFCNPKIPGFGCHQYRDSALVKTSGIQDFNH